MPRPKTAVRHRAFQAPEGRKAVHQHRRVLGRLWRLPSQELATEGAQQQHSDEAGLSEDHPGCGSGQHRQDLRQPALGQLRQRHHAVVLHGAHQDSGRRGQELEGKLSHHDGQRQLPRLEGGARATVTAARPSDLPGALQLPHGPDRDGLRCPQGTAPEQSTGPAG